MRQYRGRILAYLAIILIGLMSALPSLLPPKALESLPSWLTDNRITLGLDLRGGSHLLLEVDTERLIADEIDNAAATLARALDAAQIRHGAVANNGRAASIPVRDAAAREEAARLARELAQQEGVGSYSVSVTDSAVVLTPTRFFADELIADAVERSVEVLRRRLDETGVVEPTIARQGKDSILIQLPGVEDPSRIRDLIGTTAQLSFHLVAREDATPGMVMTVPGPTPESEYLLEKRILLEGGRLRDARTAFNPETNAPVVNFRFDKEGAERFAEITTANVGRQLAIVLDGQVITAPVIQSAITGGRGEISGQFTVAEASDLALLLRAGALPAPLKVIEERTVGPDLGSDAIQMGLLTGIIGAALVFAFMLGLYGRWGLIANLSLALNVLLSLGVLSFLGATLTLPGIAGLILSIGMAVDANILINERIREETRRGKKPFAALDAGFKRAYRTIVDSNVTTLIATCLLFLFGTGPVRGFAVTMAIGICMSMFTAVAVTRLIMEWRVRVKRPARLEISGFKALDGLGASGPVPFMRTRGFGLLLSGLLSLASLGLLVYPGLNPGLDFQGGTLVEAQTSENIAADTLRNALREHGLGDVAIQQFGNAGSFLIRAPLQSSEDAASRAVVNQVKSTVQELDPSSSFPRVEVVGPKVSGDFADLSILAVILASLGMLAYLWIRFEWPFAVGAMLTIGLDITKTLGFFALTGLEFNLVAVAALLALIGYSVNDKVVVFDRIRETLGKNPERPLKEVIDESITATLTRTTFTSATTLLALLPMGIAGGAAVTSFALPMLFGIVIGTSSSIFVASPIVLLLVQRFQQGRTALGKLNASAKQATEASSH